MAEPEDSILGLPIEQADHNAYPMENTCEACGAHIGWVMSPLGWIFALEKCDDCQDKEDFMNEEGDYEPGP